MVGVPGASPLHQPPSPWHSLHIPMRRVPPLVDFPQQTRSQKRFPPQCEQRIHLLSNLLRPPPWLAFELPLRPHGEPSLLPLARRQIPRRPGRPRESGRRLVRRDVPLPCPVADVADPGLASRQGPRRLPGRGTPGAPALALLAVAASVRHRADHGQGLHSRIFIFRRQNRPRTVPSRHLSRSPSFPPEKEPVPNQNITKIPSRKNFVNPIFCRENFTARYKHKNPPLVK